MAKNKKKYSITPSVTHKYIRYLQGLDTDIKVKNYEKEINEKLKEIYENVNPYDFNLGQSNSVKGKLWDMNLLKRKEVVINNEKTAIRAVNPNILINVLMENFKIADFKINTNNFHIKSYNDYFKLLKKTYNNNLKDLKKNMSIRLKTIIILSFLEFVKLFDGLYPMSNFNNKKHIEYRLENLLHYFILSLGSNNYLLKEVNEMQINKKSNNFILKWFVMHLNSENKTDDLKTFLTLCSLYAEITDENILLKQIFQQ